MDNKTLEKVADLLEKWENSTLSQTLGILNRLAIVGLEAQGFDQTTVASVTEDPCLTPAKAAKYLGVSVRHLTSTLTERHQIKSSGQGKARRYRLSEINRVRDERENG